MLMARQKEDQLSLKGTILGVILAGGKSTRMGADKAFVDLGGRALIAHVVERLRPQVDALAINANGDPLRFAPYDLPIIADTASERDAGPLAGLVAALSYAQTQGQTLVATAPCDAPFLPRDLVARLREAMAAGDAPVACAETPRGVEPLFALWRSDLAPLLRDHVAKGGRSPRDFMASTGAAYARFTVQAGGNPFANLNSREDLAKAEAGIALRRRNL
jgi:molybdenum cofactor guanylyltransferase